MDDFDFKVGHMVGWTNKKSQACRGEILSIHGPSSPRAVIRVAGGSVKKDATAVVSLSLLVHAGPKRNHRRDATNMAKQDDLKPVPAGTALHCYRCKLNGASVPATMYKEMQTPNGGKYRRGWCDSCLNLSAHRWTAPDENPVQTHTLDRPFRPGEEVTVCFTGKVLHYVPKQPNNVVIRVDRQGYNVLIEWVRKKENQNGQESNR
jgi:hypothetical protein